MRYYEVIVLFPMRFPYETCVLSFQYEGYYVFKMLLVICDFVQIRFS